MYGQVTDGINPVADATVKLFDNNGLPYKHTITNDAGQYTMDGIPDGTYTLGAVKDGYRLSDAMGVTLSGSSSAEINLVCTLDATLALGSIAGVLTAATLGSPAMPLGGAKITLRDAANSPIATTYTADDGEFVFYDVADGVYTLVSSADGYMATAPMTAIITGGSIANISMSMAVDTRTYNGTVSGVIRDSAGLAVAGCFVGLYSVVKDASGSTVETLVATTKTNDAGKYLFGGVSGGEYVVKAKLNQ